MLDPRWQKVVRDLWAHKSRTMLVVLSIAVGVVSFAGLLIARSAVTTNLDSDYSSANAYDIAIDLPGFDDTMVRWAAGQPGVTGAQGMTAYDGEITYKGTTHNISLLAYDDYDNIQINKIDSEAGAWPPDRGQLLIERSFLDRLGITNGDPVSIKLGTDRQHTLDYAGSVHDVTIMGGRVNTRISGYVSRRTFNQMDVPTDYNRLYVTVDYPRVNVNQVADQLRESLRERGIITSAININQNREHWAAAQINGIALILTIVGSLALIFSGFLVINIINALLMQQKRLIGVMKIVGGRRTQIIVVYLAMVACFGLLALVIALPASTFIGYQLAAYVGPQTLNFDLISFSLPPSILALEVSVALLAPMLFALIPILNATRLPAAQAISDYTLRKRSSLLEVALARLEQLPRQTLMALRNTFRQTSRLVLTLVTLVLAGALFIAISNVSMAVPNDVRKTLGMSTFDVQAFLQRPVDGNGAEQRASEVTNVVDAEGWLVTSGARQRPDGVLGGNLPLYGVPSNSKFASPSIARGRWLQNNAGDNASNRSTSDIKEIVVSTALISNKERDIDVGDVITLRRNSNPTTDQKWRVVGVLNAQLPVAYAGLADAQEFAGLPQGLVNVLNVRATDSSLAMQRQVADELTSTFEDEWNVRVGSTVTRTEAVNNLLDAFSIITNILFVVSLLIALVGGMGLAGTMSLSVMERTREIGVMRSIGARTKTLRSMFITEGLLIGWISFVAALPMSIPVTIVFDNLLASALRFSPFTFVVSPTGIVLWLVLVSVISIASSLMPARRATHISIREALAYE